MSFDANAYRDSNLQAWESSAAGWTRHQAQIRSSFGPVSHAMIDGAQLQPGQQVLELAAGLGETGLLAAEMVAPGGEVLISDQAEAMLGGARERAAELGIANVRFEVLNAEWIDAPVASFDVVLCRFGYMLMADTPAALAETRRVLRPGGVVALSVWDELERNPWAGLPREALARNGLGSAPAPGTPGPFVLGDSDRLLSLLADAGFGDAQVLDIPIEFRYGDFERMWDTVLDLSTSVHDVVMSQPPEQIEQIRSTLRELLLPYTAPDGSMTVPGSVHVARASA